MSPVSELQNDGVSLEKESLEPSSMVPMSSISCDDARLMSQCV